MGTKRRYNKRSPGDVVKGATLIEPIDGKKWKMMCQCGAVFVSQPSYTSGKCYTCGHRSAWEKRTIHHESPGHGRRASRTYAIWSNMRARCNNPKTPCYKHYGGRGISVCKEWDDYMVFKQWAESNGYEDCLEIDRIDNDGNYCPENCRWADRSTQVKNRRKESTARERDGLGRFKKKGVDQIG